MEKTKVINDIWKIYDKDGNGNLDKSEILQLLKDISKNFEDSSIMNQAENIMNLLDKDGDGKITKNELIALF